jgi:hypothetical protein
MFFSIALMVNAARSRASITWKGSCGAPGAMNSPPRAARAGHQVKRSVLSSGPTMSPGRMMVVRPGRAFSAACSHNAFNGP